MLVAARIISPVLIVAACLWPAGGAAAASSDRVVLFSVPGITWQDIADVDTPHIDGLITRGSIAANVIRTSYWRANTIRAYATLGAGKRSTGRDGSRVVLPAEHPYEAGTAADAASRRFQPPSGDLVIPDFAPTLAVNEQTDYQADLGSLGATLAAGGIDRALVTAADLAADPSVDQMRREAALGLIDDTASIPTGTASGLLLADPEGPFGVWTDPVAFEAAVEHALAARVTLIDPGDTARADEYAALATEEAATAMRHQALRRSDDLLGLVLDRLSDRDVVVVLAPTTPRGLPRDRLAPLVIAGPGFEAGGALTTPSTRHAGLTVLTDVAPTVLAAVGLQPPSSMSGAPITSLDDQVTPSDLAALDERAAFHPGFASAVGGVLIGLFTIMALLAVATFLWRYPSGRVVAGVANAVIAVPLVSLAAHAAGVQALGLAGATAVIILVTAAVGAASTIGSSLRGATVILLGTVALYAADLALGGPLQPNAPIGTSPILGGRFYGIGNPGHGIVIASAVVGVCVASSLAERRRLPWWGLGVMGTVAILVGFPWFGANFGGFATALATVAVATAIGRGLTLRWRTVLSLGPVAIGGALLVAFLDNLRPTPDQTHLGRFAARLIDGDWATVWLTIQRKAEASIGTFSLTRWAYVIPIAAAIIAFLLYRPPDVLRDTVRRDRLVRAAMIATLVGGVIGFAANDSGILVPAMMLAQLAPVVVLIALRGSTQRA